MNSPAEVPPHTEPISSKQVPISPQEYNDILAIQSSIFSMITLRSNTQEILSKLCNMAETLLDNSVASIMLLDHEGGLLSVNCAPSIPQAGHDALKNLKPGPGGGSCGNAVHSNEAQYVENTKKDSRWCNLRQVAVDFNICSCWSNPVRNEASNAVGSFALSSFEHREPALFHKKLLEICAHLVAIVLKNQNMSNEVLAYQSKLEQRVLERTNELQISLDNLKAMQGRLVENEKMALLGQLTGGVAHEINTPIGICITASGMLQELISSIEKVKTKEELSSCLAELSDVDELMSSNLSKVVSLIKSFKEVAVHQKVESKQTINIKTFTGDIVASLQSYYSDYSVDFHIQGEKNLELSLYSDSYYEILSKLIMNSLQHGFNRQNNHNVWLKFEQEKDSLHFQYSDDGRGVESENLASVFDPFYTSARQDGNVGLGLHIIYNIVTHKLKGSIEAGLSPEGGLLFNIKLPFSIIH